MSHIVEKTLAIHLTELREEIAKEIEHELDSNVSYFGLAQKGEKWFGYQDALRLAIKKARGSVIDS